MLVELRDLDRRAAVRWIRALLFLAVHPFFGCHHPGGEPESPEPSSSESAPASDFPSSPHLPGSLDLSFSGVGYVTHHNAAGGNGEDQARALVVDSVGKILVAGSSSSGSTENMVVWRFLSDGTLDSTFGPNGLGYFARSGQAGPGSFASGNAIALDSSGRILVAGQTSAPEGRMIVWRFSSSGLVDTTFGPDGMGWYREPYAWSLATGITLDGEGRILIVGASMTVANGEMSLWRLLPNGALDPSFGRKSSIGDGEWGYGVALNASGEIMVAGLSYGSSTLWRYESDGTFGGEVIFGQPSEGHSIAVDEAGRILVAGGQFGSRMALWRYLSWGTLDSEFGSGQGVVFHSGASSMPPNADGKGVVLGSGGRILVAGRSSGRMTLWRFKTDGSVDESWGSEGIGFVTHAGLGNFAVANAITRDGAGKILVAGSSQSGSNQNTADMTLWRFTE